jgi:uncharacterized protein with von Willebrand factor type A (vWA) domain
LHVREAAQQDHVDEPIRPFNLEDISPQPPQQHDIESSRYEASLRPSPRIMPKTTQLLEARSRDSLHSASTNVRKEVQDSVREDGSPLNQKLHNASETRSIGPVVLSADRIDSYFQRYDLFIYTSNGLSQTFVDVH